MKNGLALLAGLGLGVALMYLVDATRDEQRRRQLQQAWGHLDARNGNTALQSIRTALRPSALGVSLLRSCPGGKVLSDALLSQEVRAVVDKAIRRPHVIEILTDGGQVTLQGSVREEEIDALLHKVSQIPGVSAITNRLVVVEPMESAGG